MHKNAVTHTQPTKHCLSVIH
uniref:Uncharacterized protein n=1 Tax=Anguilla anguilla TaxID=7936 RepID=A0A0E9T9P3_ANGAN